ncbi:HAAS signaling domain-containing protein [Georgenia subflava]|uniref:DUF1700 domain-containing protein n=1 Tax=Georgenia subflava TaxID=1622177 RepID=A0A6N7EL79_9MICO|nr:hypothetical protein [Georgenia subflava]MPV37813.1 hypothetical protein [Georgenia subflava]
MRERIAAYLDDLGRMLEPAEPVLRSDVLGGVREHIDAALADGPQPPTDREVDRVLVELGPPEQVAAEALAHDRPAPQRPSGLDRAWVPSTVGLLLLITAGLYLVVIGAMAGFLAAETAPVVQADAGDGFDGSRTQEAGTALLPASYDMVWSALAPIPLVALPWLLTVVLLTGSSLWSIRQKWLGALLLPALVLVCGLLIVTTVLVPVGALRGVLVLGVFVAVVASTIWAVARLWRTGAQQARRVVSAGARADRLSISP